MGQDFFFNPPPSRAGDDATTAPPLIEMGAVTIRLDGTLDVRDGADLDAASRQFWSAIAGLVQLANSFETQRLRRKLAALSPNAPEMSEPEPHTLGGFARRWVDAHGLRGEGAAFDGFVGESLIGLVDCFRAQGHSGESAMITASAFAALMQDFDNHDSATWQEFWQSEAGQQLKADMHDGPATDSVAPESDDGR